jgi:hypothetical protein
MLATGREHLFTTRFRLGIRSTRRVAASARSLPPTPRHLIARTMSSELKPTERLAVIGIPLSETDIYHLQPYFSKIDNYPNAKETDADVLAAADVLYGNLAGIKSFDAIHNVKFAQLSNAGADDVLENKFWSEDERAKKVPMATVAGVHIASISQVLSLPRNCDNFKCLFCWASTSS